MADGNSSTATRTEKASSSSEAEKATSTPPAYTKWIPDDGTSSYVHVDAEAAAAAASESTDIELSAETPVAAASPLLGALSVPLSPDAVIAADAVGAPEDGTFFDADVTSALQLDSSLVLDGSFGPDAAINRLGDGFESVESVGEYTIYERTEPVPFDLVRDEGDAIAVAEGSLVVDLKTGVDRVRELVETRTGERERLSETDTEFAAATAAVGDVSVVRGNIGSDQRLLSAADDSFETTRVTVTGISPEDGQTALLSAIRGDSRDTPTVETAAAAARMPLGAAAGLSVEADETTVSIDEDGLDIDVGDDVSVDLNADGLDIDVGDDTFVDVNDGGVSVDDDDDTSVDVGDDGVSVDDDDTSVDVGDDGVSVDDDDTSVDVGGSTDGSTDSETSTDSTSDTDVDAETDGQRVDVTVDW